MSLKLNIPTPFPDLAAPSVFPNSNPRGPSEIRFSKRWGKRSPLSLSLLDHQSCRRDQIRCCGMAGGGGGGDDHHNHVVETRVWWDLNRCPVPAGVDPRRVRQCIESALQKQFRSRCAVSIYAMGNLEYISRDLLQKISSSGIILTHAPCGRADLYEFLDDWSYDDKFKNQNRYIMMISDSYELLIPQLFLGYGFTTFVAYPKGARLFASLDSLKEVGQEFALVFAKEFVWETLLTDHLDETLLLSDNNNTCDEEPPYSCNICYNDYQVCDEFITHFKSEEHIDAMFDTVIGKYGKLKCFCKVCNYHAFGQYNLFLHNQSEEHNRKMVEKQAQEEEDCESRKTNPETNPELDLFYERNKKQSLSMSLKLNTPSFPNLAAPSLLPNADLLSLSLLDHQRYRRDQRGDHHVVETRVWWDLNTCPVPAGVDPRCVRPCIESALEKQIGRRCAVSIYAMGNLENISSDLLEKISSSGIILIHTAPGKNDLYEFLDDWSDDELKNPYSPSYTMMISGDYDMLYPERFRCYYGFTNFVVYPKGVCLAVPLDMLKVIATEFAKEFVWETLFSDNLGETLLLSDNNTCDEKPLCICNICNDVYQVCDEFITHLNSEEHRRNQLFETVVDQYGRPKYFCQVCNYPIYGEDNLLLHNQCEERNRKLAEKQAQEEQEDKSCS